jgi:aspartate carbamoyltransferase catalytic subunit
MSFKGRDILSAKDIDRSSLEELFQETDTLKERIAKHGALDICKGSVLATVFLEPSTRTRLSFQFAMTKIGGNVIDFGAVEESSITKGETFDDTMRMVDGYQPDVIALRDKTPGSPHAAAGICNSPILNAGDGSNEHPTQAMLDLYTIRQTVGHIDGISIGLMGDLAHSRTTNSLSFALNQYTNVRIYFIAPEQLQVRDATTSTLNHVKCSKTDDLDEVVEQLDFLYVTRLQKERFGSPSEYERFRGSYQLNRATLERHSKQPYIMHPLPRVDELAADIDGMPVAKYFEQARNGMYIRAALLKKVLGR